MRYPTYLFIAALAATVGTANAAPVRLKDLISIEGIRDNQLVGYGLVVGLAGTGDKQTTIFTTQSLANLLTRMGVSISNPTTIRVADVASVVVTATLPAFAEPGVKIDATASAIGDATNLQGGTLLMTDLKGANGQTYAVAQGAVVTGGFVAGRGGVSQTLNHPTVGRLPEGATIEHAAPSIEPSEKIRLQLRNADFATSSRIAEAINKKFSDGMPIAHAENAAIVAVAPPADWKARIAEFIAGIEEVNVEVDRAARIVVNERTGTIVMGNDVRVSPVAILHGNLSVEIQTNLFVSQPNPLSQGGTTQIIPEQTVTAKSDPARNVVLKEGATVEELVRALTAIGSTPRDIIAILQNLHAANALNADIEVI